MRIAGVVIAVLLAGTGAGAQAAPEDAEDWRMIGRVLTLVQSFSRTAAESQDPRATQRAIDEVMAGRNAEANRIAGELAHEMGMPAELRGTLAAVVRDFATVSRREQGRAAERGETLDGARALQARRDLHAMGLRYYDTGQFLDAVKRDDALAVELYVVAQGVNLSARDADGASALDLARRAGNQRIIRLLASSGQN